MVTLIHVASVLSVVTLSIIKGVTDKDVQKNIQALRQKIWFQMYWNDESYRALIESDEQLQKMIGCINRDKLKKARYEAWQRKKLVTLLEKKMAEAC
ncbi:hypothetical protein CF394_09745 [Tetzosporium hominis]|uniref:Uncharacterized protein n=1 Tax=Tetzosporium hominis TaxID=2020506 RepID=A0A264W1P8_9BACL|nr:hypothetical protein [Tetzosporium hominis]OZS77493.1 hypothetical protein CF394_09745 [Tetzosporium hominis]